MRNQKEIKISREGFCYRKTIISDDEIDIKQNDHLEHNLDNEYVISEKEFLISRDGLYYSSINNVKLENLNYEHNTKEKIRDLKKQCITMKCNIALAIITVLMTVAEVIFKEKAHCDNAIMSSLIIGLISVIFLFNIIDKQEQFNIMEIYYKLMKASNSSGVIIFINSIIKTILRYDVAGGVGMIIICVSMIWWCAMMVSDIIKKR